MRLPSSLFFSTTGSQADEILRLLFAEQGRRVLPGALFS
jgi:hypothetical protein